MMASYVLSRTLVPIMIDLLLAERGARRQQRDQAGCFGRLHAGSSAGFERFRDGYVGLLQGIAAPAHGRLRRGLLAVARRRRRRCSPSSAATSSRRGRRPVPAARARPGRHAPGGDRAALPAVEDEIREIIPASDLDLILDNIGLPARTYNLAFGDSATIGADGEILVALNGSARTDGGVRRRAARASCPSASRS